MSWSQFNCCEGQAPYTCQHNFFQLEHHHQEHKRSLLITICSHCIRLRKKLEQRPGLRLGHSKTKAIGTQHWTIGKFKTSLDERFEMNELGCFSWDSTLSASGLTPDLVESLATEEQVTKV